MSVSRERTQIGIVGAGPAGLLLAHLLHLAGIESVILEARPRAYVESRIRAGVLEHDVAALLVGSGVGERLQREGLPHHGTQLLFGGTLHRIDFLALTGKHVTVYSQHDVVQDLIAACLAADGRIVFEAEEVTPCEFHTDRPLLRYRDAGGRHELACDIIAGCDGFHGVCRPAMPDGHVTLHEREYPFGWLGILAETPPASEELIYANHERGFALHSMRSPTVGRLYLQCDPHEDLAAWSDARIWNELRTRLACDGVTLHEGRVLQKGVTPCAASSPSRCSAGGCFWPAMPRISSRPRVRRASTPRSPTWSCSRARCRRSFVAATIPDWRAIPRPACAASGRCSASPAG